MGRSGLKQGIFPLKTEEETLIFGQEMAKQIPNNAILALTGDLGAGKTTFVKGLARGLNIEDCVQSPTFVYMNQYPGLIHFDLYRLKDFNDFIALGFDEYFEANEILAIEWPERIENILPNRAIRIHFSYVNQMREVRVC